MSTKHPSPFTLDLRWLKALASDEATRVEAHLANCPDCRSIVERDESQRRQFTSEVFPRRVDRLRHRPGRRWIWGLAPLLAVAAAVLLFVRLRPPDITIKGGPAFFAYARHAGHVSLVRDGDAMRPGDEVRFAVVPEDYSHVMVISIDTAGHASVYFPFDGATSGEVAQHQRVELPGSVVLDGTLGPERVYALFSRRPMAASGVAEILRGVARGGPDAIRRARDLAGGGDAQVTLLIEKVQ